MKNEQIIELLVKGVPHPHLIEQIEMETNAVRFTWRNARYRVGESLFVEDVGEGVLIGSDLAILMGRLLRIASISNMVMPE